MLIPKDAIIPEEKIRDYLLVPQKKSDKSQYLSLAGYSREEYWELLRDLREQVLPGESVFQQRNTFGDYYALHGRLTGPNGRRLGVVTIWLREMDGTIRFLTLFPDIR
jgi:hypothetical protein